MSEYTLPALEKKPSLHTTKKEIIIKRPTTPKPASLPPPSQKPINVFLTPSKPTTTTTLASRKASLLERIRSRSQTPSTPGKKEDSAAWDRGEWIIRGLFTILAQRGTRTRVAVSLAGTAKQLAASSGTPCSAGEVRAGIVMLARCVPWFVRVIRVVGEGCLSSPSTSTPRGVKVVENEDSDEEEEETDGGLANEVMGKRVFGGKENRGAREVEGLLIFAKRDGGGIIGQEDVLREFRGKKREWEMSTI
jgi:DNA replication factor Cdt1 C-terminal domain